MPRTGRPTIQSQQECIQVKWEIIKWKIQPTSRADHQDPDHQNLKEGDIKGKRKSKRGRTAKEKENPGGSNKGNY